MMVDNNRTYSLELPFRGEREYLHGTDIIPALEEISGPAENVSFKIHRMASRPLFAIRVDDIKLGKMRKSWRVCMIMSYENIEAGKQTIAAVEDRNRQVKRRVEYNEESIVESAIFEDKKVMHNNSDSATFVERAISLNKSLIQNVISKQPLVLMRLDLQRIPVNPHEIMIELTRVVAGQTFISEIYGDDIRIGKIFFAKRT